MKENCPSCNGHGGYASLECLTCQGKGWVDKNTLKRLAKRDTYEGRKARLKLIFGE